MKKYFLILLATLITACASFEPLPVNYVNAVEDPNSISSDSLYIYVKKIGDPVNGYTPGERKVSFDKDEDLVCGAMICISNRSNKRIDIVVSSIEGYKILNDEQIYDKYSSSGFANFIVWSVPWIANIAAKAPLYYGIIFPVIGLAEIGQANSANIKVKLYVAEHKLPDLIPPQKSIRGIVFIKHGYPKSVRIDCSHEGILIKSFEIDL